MIVNINDIARAVMSADSFNQNVELEDIKHIVEIALKKVALAAPVHVDLDNGHYIAMVVVKS